MLSIALLIVATIDSLRFKVVSKLEFGKAVVDIVVSKIGPNTYDACWCQASEWAVCSNCQLEIAVLFCYANLVINGLLPTINRNVSMLCLMYWTPDASPLRHLLSYVR